MTSGLPKSPLCFLFLHTPTNTGPPSEASSFPPCAGVQSELKQRATGNVAIWYLQRRANKLHHQSANIRTNIYQIPEWLNNLGNQLKKTKNPVPKIKEKYIYPY